MCGRFVATTPASVLAARFEAVERALAALPPNRNVAPTDRTYAVRATDEGRALDVMRWGLTPHWAADDRDAARRINARAETVATTPAFRDAFARHRCLIPVDGFYEWRDGRPNLVTGQHGGVLALAGLYATWRRPPSTALTLFDDGYVPEPVVSCTIVTTEANATMQALHHRMPVIVADADWDEWLDPQHSDSAALARLLAPAPDDLLAIEPLAAIPTAL